VVECRQFAGRLNHKLLFVGVGMQRNPVCGLCQKNNRPFKCNVGIVGLVAKDAGNVFLINTIKRLLLEIAHFHFLLSIEHCSPELHYGGNFREFNTFSAHKMTIFRRFCQTTTGLNFFYQFLPLTGSWIASGGNESSSIPTNSL